MHLWWSLVAQTILPPLPQCWETDSSYVGMPASLPCLHLSLSFLLYKVKGSPREESPPQAGTGGRGNFLITLSIVVSSLRSVSCPVDALYVSQAPGDISLTQRALFCFPLEASREHAASPCLIPCLLNRSSAEAQGGRAPAAAAALSPDWHAALNQSPLRRSMGA